MIKFNVKVELGDLAKEFAKKGERAQVILDEQILKDSNEYAPQDTGELIRSALRMSQIGRGKIIYDTPYARKLYYNPQYNFSKDRNPKAGGLWYERAKAAHLQDWVNVVAKMLGGRPK